MIFHKNIIIKIPVDLWAFEVKMRIGKIKMSVYDQRSTTKKLSITVGVVEKFYKNFILFSDFLLLLGRRFSFYLMI